eukprot:GSChrysophyteH1.ASY1.ANO1.2671.1 assembled CDS
MRPLKTPQFGKDILHDPLWNKGTAFSMVERDMLGIRGLVPPANLYLQDLANRNETADRGSMSTIVHNWSASRVDVIVVTDGSRILGLGDLGVNGMGIPIGKLALLVGPEYYDMVDEFMHAVNARWPDAFVQFEDFETPKAVPLLARYRDKYCMFNDDIQGTGSVTLSCLLSASRNAGLSSLKDLRVLCAGAGSAGTGVCNQILDGMVEAGLSRHEAQSAFAVLTNHGALGNADELQEPWVNTKISDGTSLLEAIKIHKPNVLLGLSTAKGIFNQEVLQEMARINDKPIIMPMSNPTSKAECTAEEAYLHTNGNAIVASGSPFAPVVLNGKTYIPSQCNNMYIFPGVGLACSVAEACTNTMTQEEIDEGRTFPAIDRIREVALNVAVAIVEEGLRHGMCPKLKKTHLVHGVEAFIKSKMYYPVYVPLVHER